MTVVRQAQPIRPYEPPISIVWTRGEPATEQDCVILATALRDGDAQVVEWGRWGPYNAILRWILPRQRPMYFLAEVKGASISDTQ